MNILGNAENYIGSTPEAIHDADQEENQPVVDIVDEAAEAEERRQALLAEAREQYDAWRTQQFNKLSAVAEMIMTATEEKEAVC